MALLLAGFEESAAHPVGVLTQRQAVGFGGRRYGNFDHANSVSATGDGGQSQTGSGAGALLISGTGSGGQGSETGSGTGSIVIAPVVDIAAGGTGQLRQARGGFGVAIDRKKLQATPERLITAHGGGGQSQTGSGSGVEITPAIGASEQPVQAPADLRATWSYRATGGSEQQSLCDATGELTDPELQEFLLLMMAA